MTKHKWQKEIKAWADGAKIQYRKIGTEKWIDEPDELPWWDSVVFEYRIKPQLKKPQYLYVYKNNHLPGAISIGLAPQPAMNMYDTTILGKIKLEVDDD